MLKIVRYSEGYKLRSVNLAETQNNSRKVLKVDNSEKSEYYWWSADWWFQRTIQNSKYFWNLLSESGISQI